MELVFVVLFLSVPLLWILLLSFLTPSKNINKLTYLSLWSPFSLENLRFIGLSLRLLLFSFARSWLLLLSRFFSWLLLRLLLFLSLLLCVLCLLSEWDLDLDLDLDLLLWEWCLFRLNHCSKYLAPLPCPTSLHSLALHCIKLYYITSDRFFRSGSTCR